MNLNNLLSRCNIDPEGVLILRHRPPQTNLNKVLPWLVIEKPHIFNAYQQAQDLRVENAMKSAKYVASFLGNEAGKALYVGLYKVNGWKSISTRTFAKKPEMKELFGLGLTPPTRDTRPSLLWFNLRKTDFFANWIGKLVISWPGKELSWWRWANNREYLFHAIHEESVLDSDIPRWDKINLSWDQLKVLPTRWKSALRQWRGVYYIFDCKKRMGYVGSAASNDNILKRWENYAATGHGGNQLLRKCSPENFQFSILERVSPDLPRDEVVQIENTWKERLHTRKPFGLNSN